MDNIVWFAVKINWLQQKPPFSCVQLKMKLWLSLMTEEDLNLNLIFKQLLLELNKKKNKTFLDFNLLLEKLKLIRLLHKFLNADTFEFSK